MHRATLRACDRALFVAIGWLLAQLTLGRPSAKLSADPGPACRGLHGHRLWGTP